MHRPTVMITESQNNHPLIEGQFITYTCPPGFILSGPNVSVCSGNGEWEPDPGEMDCRGNNYAQHNDATMEVGSLIQLNLLVHHYPDIVQLIGPIFVSKSVHMQMVTLIMTQM